MNILSIGGSDPSGGAGIQSDIKTFNELNAHGLTVITAVTAQNTTRFGLVQPILKEVVKDQLNTVFSDFEIDGVKISMVYNSQIIQTIFQELKDKKIPIVVDPIIKSTTGGILLKKEAINDFKKFLIPLATAITPNKFEAEFLTRIKINSKNIREVAEKIQSLGAKNIIITGIDEGKKISDFVLEENAQYTYSNRKISSTNHGSGCNYSSAMIYALTKGKTIKESVKFARKYTFDSIKNAKNLGRGIAITQNKSQDKLVIELNQAISKLITIKDIYKNIPECQTNFVFSKTTPKSITDVLGIEGRIVKTGKRITVAGNLEYGGSKHVATALIIMNQKFPEICSAINLKYQPDIILKLKRKKFRISSYDRNTEPVKVRKKEGSSIKWGIKMAIKNLRTAPDIVFHKGDFGKEPMIIIFGKTPSEILEKIFKIMSND